MDNCSDSEHDKEMYDNLSPSKKPEQNQSDAKFFTQLKSCRQTIDERRSFSPPFQLTPQKEE